MYYVYVLKHRAEWYIGYTNNLVQRYKQHRKKKQWELMYYEAYQTEKAARERERKLKHYGSAWRALKKRISA
jgi:predicted GIY-YIG superfamily endonuclease